MNILRNKVKLIGHLGADPGIKTFGTGKMKATVSLATSDVYKDSDGKKVANAQWHNLVIWGNLVKVAEKYLRKAKK